MYTILVQDDNSLLVSVKERIMQRSKLVDSLHFLVEPTYKEIDMSDFTVSMEYILPVSKKYKSEILNLSEELYNKGEYDFLEYKLPIDTCLTVEPGDIEVQLTFIKSDLDTEGNSVQYVRKTSTAKITIVPISAWSDIVPDEALNALDQRLLKVDSMIKALSETGDILATSKADNIVLDEETHEIYLTAYGEQLGDRISLDELGDVLTEATEEDGLITVIL